LAAEVIWHYLPDMVIMNNYVPSSSFNQKKINWGMLNKKVLSHLGLNLPQTIVNDLSNGKPGTIEIFLFNLKLKLDEELQLRQKIKQQNAFSPRQSLFSLNNTEPIDENKPLVSKRTSRASRSIGNLSNRWVSRLDYEELKQHCLQQQEQIEILQARMRRLEHIIHLKEIHINELLATIEAYRHSKPIGFVNNTFKKK
jgi:hypothetical protein